MRSVATKSTKIPRLRFPGFSDEWQTKKLGDFAQFSKGKNISKEDIEEDGKSEAIRYGELYTRYNEVINEVYSKTNIPIKDLVLSKANDVIIPASGETNIDIATASCVSRNNVALGGDLNIIRSNNNGVFLAYYLNNAKKKQIASLAQGVSVVHLYPSSLKELTILLPMIEEQEKIADFLAVVDDNISVLGKKITLLQKYKKGAMQQVFSQKIRFKDENGKDYPVWQNIELGELAQIKTGNLNVEDAKSDGEFTFFDRSTDIKKYDKYSFDNEALIYAGEGSEFLPRYYKGKYGLHQRAYTVFGTKINIKFLYYFMLTQNYHFLRMAVGSTVKSLRMDCFTKCLVSLPDKAEQELLAEFLSSIDEKIETEERKLEQVKKFKRALLQQIFV